jgi:hypothetical protein
LEGKKSIEDVVTLGPKAQATLVTMKSRQNKKRRDYQTYTIDNQQKIYLKERGTTGPKF